MSARDDLLADLGAAALHGRFNTASMSAALDAFRAEVRREILGDDLNPSSLVLDAQAYRRLADDIAATMDDPDRWDGDEPEDMILGRYVKWLADGGTPARKDTGDASKAPAGESTQPAPDTDASTAFMQLGTTQSLAGLRAELHIEGRPPIIGRYAGFGSRRVEPGVMLVELALLFKWLDEATPEAGEAL